MSYDVSIGSESFNYTFNVSPLFYNHIAGGPLSLDGLTGANAAYRLSAAFDSINRERLMKWDHQVVGEPAWCAKYDSPNGWGSAVGAIVFLARILAACSRYPDEVVRVGA